jgi:hypothetical protein
MPRLPHEACAACVGIAWAAATHDVGLPAGGDDQRACRRLAHQPEASEAWARALQARCAGHPVAVCLALHPGPRVSAVRQDACLGLCPGHPETRAQSRAALPPSHAPDAPTAAALQRALLLQQRAKLPPRIPQSAALRALAPRVDPRRRLVGDTGRRTHRRTRTLNNDFPHALPWLEDNAPPTLRGLPSSMAAPASRPAGAPCPPSARLPRPSRALSQRHRHAPPGHQERDTPDDRGGRARPAGPLGPGARRPAPGPPACARRRRPSHGATRPEPARLPLGCHPARRRGRLCPASPRRLRRTAGALRRRRCAPQGCGPRAGAGTPRQDNLGPWALAVSHMLATNVRGMGRGLPAACLLGTDLLPAAARQGHRTSGRGPSTRLSMEP